MIFNTNIRICDKYDITTHQNLRVSIYLLSYIYIHLCTYAKNIYVHMQIDNIHMYICLFK